MLFFSKNVDISQWKAFLNLYLNSDIDILGNYDAGSIELNKLAFQVTVITSINTRIWLLGSKIKFVGWFWPMIVSSWFLLFDVVSYGIPFPFHRPHSSNHIKSIWSPIKNTWRYIQNHIRFLQKILIFEKKRIGMYQTIRDNFNQNDFLQNLDWNNCNQRQPSTISFNFLNFLNSSNAPQQNEGKSEQIFNMWKFG